MTKEEILSAIENLTVLELAELVKAAEEKFGVSAAAPVAVAAAPAAAESEDAGASTKTVVLKSAGTQKLQVIKLIREVTGLGLKEAKDIADAGGNIKEGIPASEAEELKAKLEEVGATVELA